MLKPSDPSHEMPAPPDERPVGELVQELVENGKAYARAEIALAKAAALDKANGFKLPAILAFAALLVLLGAISAFAVGLVIGLAPLVGPVLSGLLVFLVLAGIAGGLAWFAAKKVREVL